MIRHLSINNLLLIDKIDMDIGIGLCVLTGETGAGKSMILESLELLSGRRIKSNVRPENNNKTVITALIDISKFVEIKNYLIEQEINVDNEIIVKRIIEKDGKSKAMVNENIVSLSTLKKIADHTIEIHSQFSEQGLLDSNTHLKTLDDFGQYQGELLALSKIWKEYKDIDQRYSEEKSNLEKIINKKEEYDFNLNELKMLNPEKGEFLKLEQRRKLLQNSRRITDAINQVIENFTREDPPGIDSLISTNVSLLNQMKDLLDENSKKQIDKLDSISIEILELINFFKTMLDSDTEGDSLENIDERVATYKRLAQKHSVDVENLDQKMLEIEEKLGSSEEGKINLEKLKDDLKNLEMRLSSKCYEISKIRKQNAKLLDKKINMEFPELKLDNAFFHTEIKDSEQSQTGKDKVNFKIRTNPKSKMGEIKDISSGGELCRIALAIKVTAERQNHSTMVFDEVDSGIGGAVSTAVGERLRKLGKNRQVLVVTHSPQVASLGKNHFLVKKKIIDNNLSIEVNKIEGSEKTNEIARMLSGKHITDEAIKAAMKLIENVS